MTKTKQPLVSIIVPIYNIEDYLSACLNSLVNQTYHNIEIIAVDDGSTDDSGKIAEKYAEKDKRIVVYHKKNGGRADARNFGQSKCHGDYVSFLDGDDYASKYYIETMVDAAEENNSGIVTCKYRLTNLSSDYSLEKKPTSKYENCNTIDALKRLFYQKGVTTSVWCKLYKRELLDDIAYPVGKNYEDLATAYKIIAKAKTITICQAELVYYVQNGASIMHQAFKPERLDGLKFAEEALEYVKTNIPEVELAATNRVFTEALYIFEEMSNLNYKGKKEQKIIWDIIKKYRGLVQKDKASKKNIRAYARVSYLGKPALRVAFDTKERYGLIKEHHLHK